MVDTSCLMAIALQEAGFEQFMQRMAHASDLCMSAVSRVELSIVGLNRGIEERATSLLDEFEIRIAPFDAAQATLARMAFFHFGKGRHPAALNFGDCCSYALAKALDLPLLFKGNDFSQTDIASAVV